MRIPRTLLGLTMMITLLSGCSEGTERDEGPEDEGMIELPAELLSRAEVTVEAALATALRQTPGGEIVAGELEEEEGDLIFSFDIQADGRDGVEEVHVDAHTGAVLAVEHEGVEEEASEAEGRWP